MVALLPLALLRLASSEAPRLSLAALSTHSGFEADASLLAARGARAALLRREGSGNARIEQPAAPCECAGLTALSSSARGGAAGGSCACSSPTPPAPKPAKQGQGASSQSQQFMKAFLEQRAKGYTCTDLNGKTQYFPPNRNPVDFDCRLWRAARLHAKDMATRNYFSHETLGSGKQFWDRVKEAGAGTTANGEVIAYSTWEGSAEPLDVWLESRKGHCHMIMDPQVVRIGTEFAKTPSGKVAYYWTGLLAFTLDGRTPQACLR